MPTEPMLFAIVIFIIVALLGVCVIMLLGFVPDTLHVTYVRENKNYSVKRVYGPISREGVTQLLDFMASTTSRLGVLTVGDLLGMLGEACCNADEDYGWVDLQDSKIVRTRKGYELQLPPAQVLRH